jgi:hypothetical protein
MVKNSDIWVFRVSEVVRPYPVIIFYRTTWTWKSMSDESVYVGVVKSVYVGVVFFPSFFFHHLTVHSPDDLLYRRKRDVGGI